MLGARPSSTPLHHQCEGRPPAFQASRATRVTNSAVASAACLEGPGARYSICGRIERPAFPAPSEFQGAGNSGTARANSCRGNAKVCLMKPKAPHSHASSPGLTGRPSIPETPENNREAAAYWIVRSSRTTTVERLRLVEARPHISRSIKCGIRGMSAAGIG
jgi:hypothetical protein